MTCYQPLSHAETNKILLSLYLMMIVCLHQSVQNSSLLYVWRALLEVKFGLVKRKDRHQIVYSQNVLVYQMTLCYYSNF